MKTYVINVPSVGPYVVMVRPEESNLDEKNSELDQRPVFPGTENEKDEQDNYLDSGRETRLDVQDRVEIVPYKNLHFFRS